MYNDETIQLSGGMNDFIGKLDQAPHPMGDGWYRIYEPCLIFTQDDPKNKRRVQVLAYVPGIEKNFRNFVDVYIPKESCKEIRVLDKAGVLYKIYQKEISRKAPNLILVPEIGIASPN